MVHREERDQLYVENEMLRESLSRLSEASVKGNSKMYHWGKAKVCRQSLRAE